MGQTFHNGREDTLTIAGKTFRSRLFLGTGKYRNSAEMLAAFEAADVEIITVALRRIDFDDPASRSILEDVDWRKYTILPNTAGCATAEEAIRVARMARAMGLSDWVKLEVIPDSKYLLPDPVLARRLQEIGTATVMPLASPIGSGQGLPDYRQIEIIVEQATVPVVVDAGIGVPSDAALAMEIGADACLVNSAIALARDPAAMARAMALGVEAGRLAYRAGRIPKKAYASASSPLAGVVR